MKTTWHLFIILFICVLSLGSICCAADSYKSLFTTRRKVFKAIKPSTAEDRGAIQRISRRAPPLSQLRSVHSYTLVTPSLLPGEPEAWIKADFAYAPDVSVTCSPSDFVVRVKPTFYGLGAEAQELTLGSDCRSNGISRPHGDLLFIYPLTACDGARELQHDYLVYKYVLHYEPSPKRFPSRAHQIDVNIKCHYQRHHAVYQLAVQPTWQTVVLRKKLKGSPMEFQINLMDDSWRTPAKSQVYLLGQTVNIQVSAPHLPPGLKLYTNSCYAAPSTGSKSSLKYTLIDNFGCMLDSKHEPGSSQFVSRTDKTLRFSLRTFQFTVDPDTKVSIFCKLLVTSGEPGPAQKSCTYQDHRWRALTGEDSICECCDSTCVTSKPRRALEGFAVSRPLLISDQPHASENWYQEIIPSADNRGREDEDKLHYKDLNDDQKLWEDAAGEKHEKENDKWLEESETIRGETVEPELEELADSKGVLEHKWSEPKLSDFNEFGEGESRYEEVFEASEDEIAEVKDLLLPRVHLKETFSDVVREGKLKPPNPEEGKTKKHACRGDEDRRMMQGRNEDGEVDEREETWYFTWT
ncbi:zona pellucida sperm-binding protein 3 [Xiphophorus couchianus]|uniref:zona pellucida sperm-binding protein 3 n=1 Tax=Xiphophorus couchianus TaxID=32473 RepID=UPI001016BC46|nr:zona pellucida sperm-binding protein 3-like [Xiphophorus couchianus]